MPDVSETRTCAAGGELCSRLVRPDFLVEDEVRVECRQASVDPLYARGDVAADRCRESPDVQREHAQPHVGADATTTG